MVFAALEREWTRPLEHAAGKTGVDADGPVESGAWAGASASAVVRGTLRLVKCIG